MDRNPTLEGKAGSPDERAELASLDLAAFAPYRIVVLGRMMSEQLGAAYAGEGLSIPEWRVLAVTSQNSVMAARDVVAMTPMDKMAVSRAVASLDRKGLIERVRATDRRVSTLRLSMRGRTVFNRVAAIARAYEAEALQGLSAADRGKFFELMTKLEARVRAMDKGRKEWARDA